MNVRLAVEDHLSETVLRRILIDSKQTFEVEFTYPERRRGSQTKFPNGWGDLYKNREAFAVTSATVPVFLLVDLDDRGCAAKMRADWEKNIAPCSNFLIRIAVHEVESWVLADFEGLMEFLQVSKQTPLSSVDEIRDPKEQIIRYAALSRNEEIRRDMLPIGSGIVGRGYSTMMSSFVRDLWNPRTAAEHSDSLGRAIRAFEGFKKKVL